MSPPLVSAPESVKELVQALMVERARVPLFGARDASHSFLSTLFKEDSKDGSSNKKDALGRVQHPFNMEQARVFLNTNEYHASCIQTKTQSTVGLGFKLDTQQGSSAPPPDAQTGQKQLASMRPASERLASKVDLKLDPLCINSFQDVLSSACEDFWAVGAGCIEVVRKNGTIVGLHHLPTSDVFFHVENDLGEYHFEIINARGIGGSTLHFAKFGNSDSFMSRWGKDNNVDAGAVSEVIYFKCPTSQHRWYGFPTWLAATPLMELSQCLMQFKYDYFLNRGVPEFMLFIMGQKLSKEDWTKVETALKANIGIGNSHKSLALNLENSEITVQLEKLAMENTSDENFSTTSDNIALRIVSTHRVPPLLAGILIPGKLGATNELPNALMGFQALNCGPAQRIFQQVLGRTLGGKDAGLGLSLTDFEFFTILDEVDIGVMQTTSQMRQTVPEAKAQGRDLNAGLKK